MCEVLTLWHIQNSFQLNFLGSEQKTVPSSKKVQKSSEKFRKNQNKQLGGGGGRNINSLKNNQIMQEQIQTSRNDKWDTVNSMLCGGIYFHNQLRDYKTGTLQFKEKTKEDGTRVMVPVMYQKRFYKPMSDVNYNMGPDEADVLSRIRYEVSGFVRCIMSFRSQRNSVDKAQLWANINQGDKKKPGNILLTTLEFHGNNFSITPNPNHNTNPKHALIFNDVFEALRRRL